jgi:hypothetical protein
MDDEIVMIMIWGVSIFLCAIIAERKKSHIRFWIAMGIAFGPLALPFLFFAKPLK